MNEKDYKNAINQIHASEDLKNKTYEKIMKMKLENDDNSSRDFNTITNASIKKNKYVRISRITSIAAVFMIMFFIGGTSLRIFKNLNKNENEIDRVYISNIAKNNDLPKFESIDELENTIKNDVKNNYHNMMYVEDAMEMSGTVNENSSSKNETSSSDNYSKTNNQVENVDEADIIKTDGKYIYYISNKIVYIVNAETLKIESKIQLDDSKYSVYGPEQLFINGNKLIVLGTYNEKNLNKTQNKEDDEVKDIVRIEEKSFAEAIVYDISNKSNPKEIRKVSLDGYYENSRMIGNNIYLVSSKQPMYYIDMEVEDLLPCVSDTAYSIKQQCIDYSDIAYLKNSDTCSFVIVAGFNIDNNEKISVETFYGASADDIYVSENNMYITEYEYSYKNGYFKDYEHEKTKIYKFNLNNSQIILQCTGEVEGNLNNQFSMDEYKGNLRIAITSGYSDESSNAIIILDKDLKEISKIEDLAKGERIYSVRFIGKVGYVVTFEQVDPLFVIDLSDPYNPVVKGELKIPGYSSYLHPYDETHIIGIGYNTESNGYGGVRNTTLKMSMFDVSDLENPKEMFNVSIGDKYSSSDIGDNHKVLFYYKEKNLIGLPIRNLVDKKYENSFVMYQIDLEKGFVKYGELDNSDIKYNFDSRMIYINDVIYTANSNEIVSYDIKDLKEIGKVELE